MCAGLSDKAVFGSSYGGGFLTWAQFPAFFFPMQRPVVCTHMAIPRDGAPFPLSW